MNLPCKYKDTDSETISFYIAIESDVPAILGHASSKCMNIVSLRYGGIGIEINALSASSGCIPPIIHDVNNLKQRFPHRFDILECFPEKYYITVNESVTPRKYHI